MQANSHLPKEVRLYDYSEFDDDKCLTGGAYGFWEKYVRNGAIYTKTYHTTSELEYCLYCGMFCSKSCCDGCRLCEAETVTPEELFDIIQSFKKENENDADYWITGSNQRDSIGYPIEFNIRGI